MQLVGLPCTSDVAMLETRLYTLSRELLPYFANPGDCKGITRAAVVAESFRRLFLAYEPMIPFVEEFYLNMGHPTDISRL